MGILQRFGDIMRSNINALLDKAEDPAKMVDQMLIDAKKDLAEAKVETKKIMANAEAAKRDVEKTEAKINEYDIAIRNAVRQGDEASAKELIATKQQHEAQLTEYKKNYEAAHASEVQIVQLYKKREADIKNLEMRKDTIKAKVTTAKAQEHMNDIATGLTNSRSLDAFDRMEAKADRMLDMANAGAELDAGASHESDLLKKYGSGAAGSVDDELAKVRAELGLAPADIPTTSTPEVVKPSDDDVQSELERIMAEEQA